MYAVPYSSEDALGTTRPSRHTEQARRKGWEERLCEECSVRTHFMRRCAAKGLGPVVGAAPETYVIALEV